MSVEPRSSAKEYVPDGWRWQPLSDLCTLDRVIVEPSSVGGSSLPYLSLEHVQSGTGKILGRPESTVEDRGRSSTFLFDSRHVLYGKLRPYLNKVALPGFDGRCTTELIPLLPTPQTDRIFLAWILRRGDTVAAAMSGKTGSRMPRADLNALFSLRVAVPPLAEQRRIAAIVDDQMAAVERARAAAEQQLAAARALPSAYLRSVFDGDEAASWTLVRIADVADTASGTTPSRGRLDYYAGTIPWVKTAELRDGRISATEEHVSEAALAETSLRALPVGTLLVAMYGQGQTRGRTGLLDVPSTTNQACFAVLPNHERFDPRYLQLWFQYSYHRLRVESEARGNSQPNLNGDVLRGQMFPLAPLEEQHRVVNHIDHAMQQAATLRSHVESQSRDLKCLPSSLLARALGGEL